MELILSIIIIIVAIIFVKYPSWKADNRMSPPGKKTDWSEMNMDGMRGMSNRDINKKFNAGGYDIPDKCDK